MEAQRRIDGELSLGESLLWAGQPSRMAGQGIVPMPPGIPWAAFAVFWTAVSGGFGFLRGGAVGRGRWSAGGPVSAVSSGRCGCLSGRTLYAVTSKRVIMWSGRVFGGTAVRSLSPGQLGDRMRQTFG